MEKIKYGFIVCAGKQKRFSGSYPKALATINNKCLLDINYSLMKKYCENVYVVCSFYNEEFFDNEKYKKIVVNSGFGSGDAVLRAINTLITNKVMTLSKDKIIICWGDALIQEDVYKKIINNVDDDNVIIPCTYEKNPYVQFKELENNKLSVLFSKYGDDISDGYHDMCIFLSPIDILFKYLVEFKVKFYNPQYDFLNNYYIHKHNNEFEFLDIFNDTDIHGKIIELDNSLSTFSFNTIEELNKFLRRNKNMKDYPVLKVKLLSENAKMPTRGTPGSSGLDVYTPVDIVIEPRKDVLIPLDLAFEIPFGWDLSVYNKSGVSTKKKLDKGAELIDSDYRGNCHIHFFNNSDEVVTFNKGDKISQLVMREVWMGELEQVDELSDTVRGNGGFGSTGDK